jgi:hypothetical protein
MASWRRLFGLLPERPKPDKASAPARTVAAMVEASGLPPEVRTALLDPARGLRLETTPQAIDTAKSILDVAAAFHGGSNPRPLAASTTAVLVRKGATVETARAELMERKAVESEAEGELITSLPQPGSGPSSASEIYSRRKRK